MTTQIEVLKMMVAALEISFAPNGDDYKIRNAALEVGRAAIEAAEKVEPVGCVDSLFDEHVIKLGGFDRNQHVYLSPPSAEIEELRKDAFEMGWRIAATWADRNDLYADIGSPAYLKDRAAALKEKEE